MYQLYDLLDNDFCSTHTDFLRYLGKCSSHPWLEKYAKINRSNTINVFVVNQEIDNYTLLSKKHSQKGDSLIALPGSTDINSYSFKELMENAETNGEMAWNGILKSTIQTHTCSPTIVCPSCKGGGKCYKCSGEGNVICKECEGSGQCNNCDGTGHETCPDCDGTGKYECEHCDGDGYFECEDCDGTGTYNHNGYSTKCKRCHGTGKLTCRKCNGEGNVTCNNCDGDGYITCRRCEGDGLCSDCNGAGKVRCEECKGSGLCEKCKGTGQIPCPRCGGLGCFQSFQSYTISKIHKCKEKIFPKEYKDIAEKTDLQKNIWTGVISYEKQKCVSLLDKSSLYHELSYFTGTDDVIKYIISTEEEKELPPVLYYRNNISLHKTIITEVVYSVGKKEFVFFLINNNKKIVIDTDKMPNRINIIRSIKKIFKK